MISKTSRKSVHRKVADRHRRPGDPGAADQHVDPAEGPAVRAAAASTAGQSVMSSGTGMPSIAAATASAPARVAVPDRDPRPFRGHPLGHRPADARRAPGHHRPPPREAPFRNHRQLPFLPCAPCLAETGGRGKAPRKDGNAGHRDALPFRSSAMHHGDRHGGVEMQRRAPGPDPVRELPAARAPGLPRAEPRGARLHARLQARRAHRRSGRHHPARGDREPASLHHPRRLGVPAQDDRGRPPAGAELRPARRSRRAAGRDHERDAAHRHRADPDPALRLPARQGLVGLHATTPPSASP